MKEAYPEMLVGAGTVLTTSQVDEAVNAGAEFIVSPGLNPEVVEYCIEKNIPILPGCANPSDVEQAIKYGLKVVKFFPAEAAGGIKTIKAMAAPYHQMKFMPTGGVNPDNINEYLNFDKIIACGGTWMVKDNLIKEKKFDEIQNLTTQAVHKMLGFKLAHIGINCDNEEQAHKVAEAFDFMFGFAPKENPSSIFSDTYVETMKTPFLGTKGHIAIAVNSVERAKAYLEQKNIAFNEDSAVYRPDGKISMDLSDQNGILRIEIKDQGIGIPDVKKAMEPMFTTKPEEERTGMGFSFMEAFMDQVEVISKQGEGTTVIMTKKIGDQDKLNG